MQPGLPEEFRLYAAQLAAHLAGLNGELVPPLLQYLRPDQEPAESLKEIRNDILVDPSLLPDPARLGQSVWKAQIQTVFADIEMARLRIVSDWPGDRVLGAPEKPFGFYRADGRATD